MGWRAISPRARPGELKAAYQSQGARDHFGGALQASVPGILEEVAVEQHPQDCRHVAAGVHKGVGQQIDGVLVLGRSDLPSRNLRLVRHEEVVKVAGNEGGGGGMFADDVDDVFAVEVARLAEESLLAVVVVFRQVLELPVVAAYGATGQLGLKGPAGKGAGGFANVDLGVGADAHAEQLQQLAAPVLVDGIGMVFKVVQPVDHRRVLGDFQQQILVIPHALLAEQGQPCA